MTKEHDYTPVSHLMGKRALCEQRDQPHLYSSLCGVFSIKDVIFHFYRNKRAVLAAASAVSSSGSAATDANLNEYSFILIMSGPNTREGRV